MTDDPIITEIRDIRMNLEKKLGGSSSRMQRYFMNIQKKSKSRIVSRKTQPALRHARAG
ncbi:MAG: hypothetical protein WAX69_09310 [Victivallales bacterium]